MTNLYAEWKKLRDNVQSASARLYLEKNENTEREYEEALERLGQFERENRIPLIAVKAKFKKMFHEREWKMKKIDAEKRMEELAKRNVQDINQMTRIMFGPIEAYEPGCETALKLANKLKAIAFSLYSDFSEMVEILQNVKEGKIDDDDDTTDEHV